MMPEVESELEEVPCKTNPLGVKGIGEAGTIGSTATVVNAIVDALSPFVAKQIYQGYGFDLATHMARSALQPVLDDVQVQLTGEDGKRRRRKNGEKSHFQPPPSRLATSWRHEARRFGRS